MSNDIMGADPHSNEILPANLEENINTYLHEYNTLESTIDQLNNFMDELEQRNDSLRQRIKEHLEETRNNRFEFLSEETKLQENELIDPNSAQCRLVDERPDESSSNISETKILDEI